MAAENAPRDGNYIPAALFQIDGAARGQLMAGRIDQTTGRILVDASGGTGTVTTVSVASANGFAGTVANPTTTPAIMLSTTITGLLKGNGTAISAATAGTDYSAGTSALATGILKSTTGTGALTIATGADLPTMTATVGGAVPTPPNNTTTFLRGDGTFATPAGGGTVTNVASADGSVTVTNPTSTVDLAVVKAPKWSTARNLAGNSVDGSANVAFANKFIVQGTTDAGLSGAQFLGALTTGILKVATTTGVLTTAVAGDFPTLNQNTTGTAAGLTTGRTISISGDLAYTSPSFDGTGNVTAAGTLATVNSNVGSFGSATQVATFTVNGKGLTTAASNVTITPAVGSITGLGTGVATALAINIGTAGCILTNGGALGTPSSGTLTNATGLPISTGVSGLASGIATFLATPSSANLLAAMTDKTGTGLQVFGTTPTLATPVINGLPTGTGVASAATVSTLAARDANGNLNANNTFEGFTTTATAAATTTLTVASTQVQVFTGATTQTVKLPTTSVPAGAQYLIVNQSSGAVTVQSSGANTITILAAGTSGLFTAGVATPTTAGNWAAQYFADIVTSGKSLSVSNTLILAGTDGTTITFPGTSATMARTDAAQTFTGTQTFAQVITTANAITATANAATIPVTSRHNIVTNNSAAGLTITLTTAGAVNMQTVVVQILDFSAAAQTLTFVNTENSLVSVPTTSNGSTTLPITVGFIYNSATSKWRCIASA